MSCACKQHLVQAIACSICKDLWKGDDNAKPFIGSSSGCMTSWRDTIFIT